MQRGAALSMQSHPVPGHQYCVLNAFAQYYCAMVHAYTTVRVLLYDGDIATTMQQDTAFRVQLHWWTE